ncbi:hypothetical protein DYB35_013623, partial [Aphanomyces astaci]
PGAATGVVTQVKRILPHLLEVDRMGVIMVDPSVVEDPAGTTVVLLALREAAPEETALVPDSPTHPWSPVRLRVKLCPMLGKHFLAKFDTIQKECGLNDTQEFIQKTLSRKMAEITDNSHRKSTETVREYAWQIADASREAGLQSNKAVVMMTMDVVMRKWPSASGKPLFDLRLSKSAWTT